MKEPTKNRFGERLALLREEAKLTQAGLAKIFDTKKATISRYENGLREPDFDTLIMFSDYFKVSTDYLLGKSNSKK